MMGRNADGTYLMDTFMKSSKDCGEKCMAESACGCWRWYTYAHKNPGWRGQCVLSEPCNTFAALDISIAGERGCITPGEFRYFVMYKIKT